MCGLIKKQLQTFLVFSLHLLAKKHRITYDSAKEDAFIVHQKDRKTKFKASKNGLYYFKPEYRTGTVLNDVASVQDNKKGY